MRTVTERIYKALPNGDFGILESYARAFGGAKRFIYLENQFLWSPEIAASSVTRSSTRRQTISGSSCCCRRGQTRAPTILAGCSICTEDGGDLGRPEELILEMIKRLAPPNAGVTPTKSAVRQRLVNPLGPFARSGARCGPAPSDPRGGRKSLRVTLAPAEVEVVMSRAPALMRRRHRHPLQPPLARSHLGDSSGPREGRTGRRHRAPDRANGPRTDLQGVAERRLRHS